MNVDIGTKLCLESGNKIISCNLARGVGTRRWYRNGAVLSGVTDSTFTVSTADRGSNITCEISNQCGRDSASTIVTCEDQRERERQGG